MGSHFAEVTRPPRILFVGMQNSPHTARWIEMIAEQNWDLHLFPINSGAPNANMCAVQIHVPQLDPEQGAGEQSLPLPLSASEHVAAARIVPFPIERRLLAKADGDPNGLISLGEAGGTVPALHGPRVLSALIRELEPDLIHSMEFQLCGYLVDRAKEFYVGSFPKWLATNWGSDIFHFGRDSRHRRQIEHLLQSIDYYSCECHRDIDLAHTFGYRGPILTVLPNTGGFDLAHIRTLQSKVLPSRRKRIMVKGYEHFAGRAMRSLAVLESLSEELKGYEIVLYSVSAEPRAKAKDLRSRGVLDITILDWASHDEMLSYFGSARLYLGVSISDAISTSVLEAMAMGTFPIQTDTSCCDEWFDDGVGGFVVPPDDLDIIRDRVLAALSRDDLVDRAAEVNARTVERRLDRQKLGPRVAEFYKPVFDHLRIDGRLGPGLRLSPERERDSQPFGSVA